MYQPIPLEFHKLSPSLDNLFYGLAPQDHACYAVGTGKIDGIPTFLTFVATESFLTILVDYGAHRDDMEPFELTRDVIRLSAAKQLCFSIDWHDINSEFLKNELGFDFINYGKTATSRTPSPQKPTHKTPHVFDHPFPKCFVIITRNVDGENPDGEPNAKSLNKAVEAMLPERPYFYEIHQYGMDLLVVLNEQCDDENTIRTLAILELQDME
jgi:hypothetical protein